MSQTALYNVHKQLGAAFTDFGGWDMPLKYGSELAEHRAVRQTAGLFDLSHMGEVRVSGPDAAAYLDYTLLARYTPMEVGRAKYGVILDAAGHTIDDLITYRLADDEFLVVPNAANTAVVFAAMSERTGDFEVTVVDESAQTSLVAVQGPAAEAILLATQGEDTAAAEDAAIAAARAAITELRYYAWTRVEILGVSVLLARTGYTGEDGFELFVDNAHAVLLWNYLENVGEDKGLVPCGLASRDSLRLEAGMPLFGHEMDSTTSPFDAGLGGMVRGALKHKGEFFARAALEAMGEPTRVLVGLSSEQRRAARAGATVLDAAGAAIGMVTSGQPSPTLGHPIALAYVDTAVAAPGTQLSVDVRGKGLPFTVVELPFYRRQS